MVLYSPDWTNIGFSFIILTVNLFCHTTLIEHVSTADFLTLYMVKWSWVLLKMNNSTPVIYNEISYILS